MYNNLHKYKYYFILLLKLVIVSAAIYYIFEKLTSNTNLTLQEFQQQLILLTSNNIWLLIALLLFTDVNWFLEIFKWKSLASQERKISFFEAYKQCFASLTASIITPNRIGEYGAKALFFEKEKRKKIMVLNLVGNLFQLISTLFFGIIGLACFFLNYNIKTPYISLKNPIYILLISVLFISSFFVPTIKKQIVSTLNKTLNYLKQIPKNIHLKTITFSIARYVIFSHQFYFILILLNTKVDYFTCMQLIFSMYLLASIIPSISIFDWAIKGSIALWLFSFVYVDSVTIFFTTTLMWILNFAIPTLIGSIFVLNFKVPVKK
ncbi:Lysylphosphatidylglycerol synthase TM region [Lutibacter oricola]|uniref:Lysylphosphatidylglycerol synthase TM region n=1 Tax=Lutibacter oricola TaxID=762486 RepID=A0A1H2U2W4_9FLAO|nr:lysylphosphatidylglycerol synthase domain-containing protein [Lutibacter oricola]SDW50238.1 Lysylphosphatidylglycerol synthase TM region [Lutibacter oricola]